MEDEIDLRQYVSILIKSWYWIIGLALVAGVAAFVASAFIPPTFQATALVTATQSRYELQFDPRFRNIPDSAIQSLLDSQYRTYPTLSTSDDLLQQLAEETGWDLDTLKKNVKAQADDAPNLLALTVEGQDAAEVARVANTWAELFVKKANTLYGSSGELERFKQQQEIVGQSLREADQTLTAFREENGFGFGVDFAPANDNASSRAPDNPFGLIGQRLQSKNSLLTAYEAELVRLRQMQREVELLSKTTTSTTSPVVLASLLSEMVNSGVTDNTQPYQVRFDAVDPVAALAAMAEALQSRAMAIEAEMETLRDDIVALQTELAAKQEQLEQLLRDRDVKAETFAVISRKVQEAQIDTSSESANTGKVQIASRAAAPTRPINSGRLRNAAVAAMLGLMLGVFGVLFREWWQNTDAETPGRPRERTEASSHYGEAGHPRPAIDDVAGQA